MQKEPFIPHTNEEIVYLRCRPAAPNRQNTETTVLDSNGKIPMLRMNAYIDWLDNPTATASKKTYSYQTTREHKRSMIMGSPVSRRLGEILCIGVDRYTDINAKGATAYEDPEVRRSAIEDNGIYIQGYCTVTNEQIERLFKGSDFCYKNGINAEHIQQIYILEEIYDADANEIVSVEEFKRRLVIKYKKAIPDIEERLETLNFVVWERAMPIAERVLDLVKSGNVNNPASASKTKFPKVFLRLLRKAINNINRIEQLKGNTEFHLSPLYPEKLLLDYTIPNFARNLAMLHRLGLATSGYCNIGNIMLNGGLCDLEDLIGTPISESDTPITEDDCKSDIHIAYSQFKYLLMSLRVNGKIPDDPKIEEAFYRNFFITYYQERFGDTILDHITEIWEYFDELIPYEQSSVVHSLFGIDIDSISCDIEMINRSIPTSISEIDAIIEKSLFKQIEEQLRNHFTDLKTFSKRLQFRIAKLIIIHKKETFSQAVYILVNNLFKQRNDSDHTYFLSQLDKLFKVFHDLDSFALLEAALNIQFQPKLPIDEKELVEYIAQFIETAPAPTHYYAINPESYAYRAVHEYIHKQFENLSALNRFESIKPQLAHLLTIKYLQCYPNGGLLTSYNQLGIKAFESIKGHRGRRQN